MSGVAGTVWEVVYTTASLLWMATWALVLGYAFSSAIQVFVKSTEAADRLGGGGIREIGLATGLGFISSGKEIAFGLGRGVEASALPVLAVVVGALR